MTNQRHFVRLSTLFVNSMPNSQRYMGSYSVGNSFDCDVIFRNGFE